MEATPEQQAEGAAVVRVLAAVLERLVTANAPLAQSDGQVTKFHALKAPSIGILQYLERIHKYSSCSTECFILALIYIDRLIQRNNFLLTHLNVHRVVISSVLVAAKFFDDAYYNNAYYAKVGGVLVSELNSLEVEFLFRINFALHVPPDLFSKYSAELMSHAVSPPPSIETSLPSMDCAPDVRLHPFQVAEQQQNNPTTTLMRETISQALPVVGQLAGLTFPVVQGGGGGIQDAFQPISNHIAAPGPTPADCCALAALATVQEHKRIISPVPGTLVSHQYHHHHHNDPHCFEPVVVQQAAAVQVPRSVPCQWEQQQQQPQQLPHRRGSTASMCEASSNLAMQLQTHQLLQSCAGLATHTHQAPSCTSTTVSLSDTEDYDPYNYFPQQAAAAAAAAALGQQQEGGIIPHTGAGAVIDYGVGVGGTGVLVTPSGPAAGIGSLIHPMRGGSGGGLYHHGGYNITAGHAGQHHHAPPPHQESSYPAAVAAQHLRHVVESVYVTGRGMA